MSNSLRTWMLKELGARGLWPQEAEAIAAVVIEKSDEDMKRRWGDDISGYPDTMRAVLWMTICHEADTWLEANKPRHFARPMFNKDMMDKLTAHERN